MQQWRVTELDGVLRLEVRRKIEREENGPPQQDEDEEEEEDIATKA